MQEFLNAAQDAGMTSGVAGSIMISIAVGCVAKGRRHFAAQSGARDRKRRRRKQSSHRSATPSLEFMPKPERCVMTAPAKFRLRVRQEGRPDRWLKLGDDRKSLAMTTFVEAAYAASRESMEAIACRQRAKNLGSTYIVEKVQ
ncbi:MAG: hypothetical protein HZY79_00530 [Rhodoblastus sp.]|nr:MAG: hypothetical protein HZY79_00530 [Rhodoblastus sp.]